LFASFFPIRESGWWYSFDCESERLLVSMLLLQVNLLLSQLNANWHDDNRRPTELDASRCMSLPFATQNTQYYLRLVVG
jgi:hypothetical protein